MKGHQFIIRAIIRDLEGQFGPGIAFPATFPLLAAYEQVGKLYDRKPAPARSEDQVRSETV